VIARLVARLSASRLTYSVAGLAGVAGLCLVAYLIDPLAGLAAVSVALIVYAATEPVA